jgi:hypothetical protein
MRFRFESWLPNCNEIAANRHFLSGLARNVSGMPWRPPFLNLTPEPRSQDPSTGQLRCGWGTVASRLKLGIPQPHPRKVERPSYEQVMEDVRTMSFLAVGRRYGVSDNAIRKWIRWYERGKTKGGEAEGE